MRVENQFHSRLGKHKRRKRTKNQWKEAQVKEQQDEKKFLSSIDF